MPSRSALPALLSLSLGYFSLGTISLAVVGLNGPIGDDLHVQPATVGILVTVFALTFAVCAPTAPILLRRWNRKRVLLVGVGLLTVGAALGAVAPNYGFLTVTRVLGAMGAAVFGPGASAAGALIVPPERRQRALATVFGGMTAAAVLGVPLASFLGGSLGWRPALLGVAALSALSFVAVLVFVPEIPAGEPPTVGAYREAMRTPATAATVTTTLLFMAAQFTVYGIAGAYLKDRFGASSGLISLTLLAFGVIGVAGNACAPRIAERLGGGRTVSVAVLGLALGFVLLLVAPHSAPGVVFFAFWAFFSQLYQAPQQARLVELVPLQPGLILAMNAAALYLGMSLGSFIGSSLLPGLGAGPIPWAALGVLVLAGLAHLSSVRQVASAAAGAERSATPVHTGR
ncbi:MFS transporter [Streptomyces sp. NPDC001714]|uniref:MFS transporter n=1 Tax=Streptomyces sp. NPDC001714 TaxID=3364603 RepID=UPI0036C72E42